MKVSTMILILVAAGCGLVAAILVSGYGFGKTEVAPPPDDKVDVLVAKAKIERDVMVNEPEKLFDKARLPKNDTTKDRVDDFAKVKGRTLKKAVDSGVALAESDLFPPNHGITTKLKPGERPWSIKVNELSSTGGFIRPEEMVDVIATMEHKGELISETILQNLEVLAVDQDMQQREGQVHKPSNVITIRVKPDQVELLAALARVCTLNLVPRTSGDNVQVPPGTRIVQLLKLKPTAATNEKAFLPEEGKEDKPAGESGARLATSSFVPTPHKRITINGATIQITESYPGGFGGGDQGTRTVRENGSTGAKPTPEPVPEPKAPLPGSGK